MMNIKRMGVSLAMGSMLATGLGIATAAPGEAASCGLRTDGDVLVYDACSGDAGRQLEVIYHPPAPNVIAEPRYVCLGEGTTTIGPVWKQDHNFWKGGYTPSERGIIGPC